MGKIISALYTLAVWVYVDETKIKKQKRFPWNAKYETVWGWLASFITLYTLLEVKI